MFKNLRSLREKLMITVLLLLAVPMGIVVLIAQVRSQAVIRSQALTLSTKLVTAGAARLETSCERIDDIYRSIYLNEGFRAFLRGAGREKSTAERHRETDQLQSVFLSRVGCTKEHERISKVVQPCIHAHDIRHRIRTLTTEDLH